MQNIFGGGPMTRGLKKIKTSPDRFYCFFPQIQIIFCLISLPEYGSVFVCVLSHFRLFAALWAVARQAPLSMGFSRQEHWYGLPCPPPWYHSDPASDLCLLCLLHWQASSLPLVPPGKPLRSVFHPHLIVQIAFSRQKKGQVFLLISVHTTLSTFLENQLVKPSNHSELLLFIIFRFF